MEQRLMDALSFYKITQQQLSKQAEAHGVSNLSRYYKLTDYHEGSFLNTLQDKSQVFAQIAFHAQNATMISSIVKFESNFDFLEKTLCHFDPGGFSKKFHADSKAVTDVLRYNESTGEGLKWNSEKSKKKDSIINRYSNTLIEAARFVKQFESREAFLEDLLQHYENANYVQVIEHFKSKIPHGFSVALTCDFLKEFDSIFSDLPKPDIHIKDTLCALLNKEKGYYSGKKKELEVIKTMRGIVAEINKNISQDEQITVYQLDRMIWLICSDNFFLDVSGNNKENYLQALRCGQ